MSPELPGSDRMVATALRLLPVPEHGDDFWSSLEVRLVAEPTPSGAAPVPLLARPDGQTTAVPTIDLLPVPVLVPPAMRRRSNLVLSAVAVAAAVMVVVAGTTLVRQRTADDPAETATAAQGSDASTETTVAALVAPEDGGPAAEAVVSWIQALSEGDLDAAWKALGPASQAHWGNKEAFAQERTAFAEGYGAWASSSADTVLVTSIVSSGDGEVVVVTLVGRVQQEGSLQARADAFPVRVVQGEAVLELYPGIPGLELVVPERSEDGTSWPTVGVHDELVVVVPPGVDAPLIRLDDGPVLVCGEAAGTELTPLEGSTGQRCGYTPEGGIPAGDRVLTVAFTSADGSAIEAESVLFKAA